MGMNLKQVIQNHYDTESRTEIIRLLKSLALYNRIAFISWQFYNAKAINETSEMHLHFNRHAQMFFNLFSRFVRNLPADDQQEIILQKVSDFMVFLMVAALDYCHIKPFEIYNSLIKMVNDDALLAENHRARFYAFFDEVFRLWRLNYTNGSTSTAVSNHNAAVFFDFIQFRDENHEVIKLEFFVADLCKAIPGLKPHNNLFLLFCRNRNPYFIEVPPDYLLHFLAVFYIMHDWGRIRVKNSRGLFKHLLAHLKAPGNEEFPQWKDLSKYFHDAMRNERLKKKIYKDLFKWLQKYRPEK
jgi:hypothetical protein